MGFSQGTHPYIPYSHTTKSTSHSIIGQEAYDHDKIVSYLCKILGTK